MTEATPPVARNANATAASKRGARSDTPTTQPSAIR